MLSDCQLPACLTADGFDVQSRGDVAFASARWTPAGIARVVEHLDERGRLALEDLGPERILAAWQVAIDSLRKPQSPLRRELDPVLARLTGLSVPGVAAALEVLLEGAIGPAASEMARTARPAEDRSPVAVFLAGNLPGLALQAMLPPLLRGRPVILKTSSSEPLFTPRLAAELVAAEPTLGHALAVLAWPGGDHDLERPVLEAAGRVVAYGDRPALLDLEERVGERLMALGPALSLAILGAEVEPERIAPGLARDIALFDQRGCLSLHAIYTTGDTQPLADALARSLRELSKSLPVGTLDPLVATDVQQLRLQADLRGLYRPEMALAEGTVIVESLPDLRSSPGLRSIRVHGLDELGDVVGLLEPWRARLQGAALAGDAAWRLRSELAALGFNRFSEPGSLQRTDYSWCNGGLTPLETFGGA